MVMTHNDMTRRTFLGQPKDDGEKHQARIVKAISDHDNHLESNPERIKYVCSFNDDRYE